MYMGTGELALPLGAQHDGTGYGHWRTVLVPCGKAGPLPAPAHTLHSGVARGKSASPLMGELAPNLTSP